MQSPGKLWLALPPVALSLLDQALTLYWQPQGYWSGRYDLALEGSPFRRLLELHPVAYGAWVIVWIALFTTAIFLLPRRLAMVVSMGVVIGHTWGTASWIFKKAHAGYWLCILLFVYSAVLIVVAWEKAMRGDRNQAGLDDVSRTDKKG